MAILSLNYQFFRQICRETVWNRRFKHDFKHILILNFVKTVCLFGKNYIFA